MQAFVTEDRLGNLLQQVTALPRPVLEKLIEGAIERLDLADGDPDIEDAEGSTCVDARGRYLRDAKGRRRGRVPAGMLEDDEDNHDREAVNEDGSDALLPTFPTYGTDQSMCPLNERSAYMAHQRALLGMGAS